MTVPGLIQPNTVARKKKKIKISYSFFLYRNIIAFD